MAKFVWDIPVTHSSLSNDLKKIDRVRSISKGIMYKALINTDNLLDLKGVQDNGCATITDYFGWSEVEAFIHI
jgi:hypothetical protein